MDEAETVHVPNMRLTTVRPDVHSVNIRRSFDDVYVHLSCFLCRPRQTSYVCIDGVST